MHLFQLGDFLLNSGARAAWNLECDALTDEDWQALAYMVSRLVGPFSSVEGVPRGGLQLAEALQPYTTLGVQNNGHLIVDDVLTTGGSLERVRTAAKLRGSGPCVGAVVFARGRCPEWVKAVLQLPRELWLNPPGPATQAPAPAADGPLCVVCHRPIAGMVHFQGGSLSHPVHEGCEVGIGGPR